MSAKQQPDRPAVRNGDALRTLARALRGGSVAADWTDGNGGDPGVTLLELLAFAMEDLVAGGIDRFAVPEREAVARRLQDLALALQPAVPQGAGDDGQGLPRLNYFVGQVLGADDLLAEQDYFRARLRRLNRWLHGSGIVSGLEVTIERKGASDHVVVGAGLAIDARGEEIEVSVAASLPLPGQGAASLVLIRHAERPRRPVPASGAGGGLAQASRIEEGFELALHADADAGAVALARVKRAGQRWVLDRRFRPARVAGGPPC